MVRGNDIRYLSNELIERSKWNKCIEDASNGLVYAFSFYLDRMSVHWDALVLNDYEAVMPLTWNRKYGVYYLYQPFLCASLGIFGNQLNAVLISTFLEAVPRKFRYWDIYLNHNNLFDIKSFTLYERLNHTLLLRKTYDELYAGFRPSYKQLLKRFDHSGSRAVKNIPVKEVLELSKAQMNPRFNVSDEDYAHFEALYEYMVNTQSATNYGIYSSGGELLASGIFLFSHKRAYYILAGNHPNGRTLGASHQVINAFIKDHAGQDLVLDFEGSRVFNIAFFFKGFGAKEERYPGIVNNRLPFYLKWMKGKVR